MRLTNLLPIFWFSIFAACGPLPDPVEPPILPTCETACDHARDLGCSFARPTPGGEPCERYCENVQTSGFLRWDLGCRSIALTCMAIDACER